MNQEKLVLVNLLMLLIIASITPLAVEGVFAGAGRYGYGKKETKVRLITAAFACSLTKYNRLDGAIISLKLS